MAILESFGNEVHSIFQLLGEKENGITLSMSWALSKCPEFLKLVVNYAVGQMVNPDSVTVMNQRYDAATGITDIEVTDNKTVHIIFEAKRGWILPGAEQLTKYSVRDDFSKSVIPNKRIVTLSECTQDYAKAYLPFTVINGIRVSHMSWREVYNLAMQARSSSNHEHKHLLVEFCEYMRGIMTMQKKDSNWVYVVALGVTKPDNCSISWIDIVQNHNKYFCPLGGNGWPKEPPNYIGFRYYGQLQSVHHIDSYTVTRNMHDEIPEMPDEVWDSDCYVYKIGPAIAPSHTVKTGNIYRNGRVWAMFDTLLTCDTISRARDLSQDRMK